MSRLGLSTLLLALALSGSVLAEPTPNTEATLRSRHFQAVVGRLKSGPTSPCSYFVDGVLQPRFSLEEIGGGRLFAMTLQGARAEDALVAAGVALAREIPSLYLVQERTQLPWFLREADQTYPGLVTIGTTDSIKLPDGATRPQDAPRPFDNFIGCIMSGLSQQQYAEGQNHLRAIDQALARLGGSHNFCEGLNVANPASFGTPRESLGADLASLKGSGYAVFYVYDVQPRPSGMWVELGAALAWNKPCLLLVPAAKAGNPLPPTLATGPLPANLRIVEYGDHDDLLKTLHDPERARALLHP